MKCVRSVMRIHLLILTHLVYREVTVVSLYTLRGVLLRRPVSGEKGHSFGMLENFSRNWEIQDYVVERKHELISGQKEKWEDLKSLQKCHGKNWEGNFQVL